jgi:hypothetical protein
LKGDYDNLGSAVCCWICVGGKGGSKGIAGNLGLCSVLVPVGDSRDAAFNMQLVQLPIVVAIDKHQKVQALCQKQAAQERQLQADRIVLIADWNVM